MAAKVKAAVCVASAGIPVIISRLLSLSPSSVSVFLCLYHVFSMNLSLPPFVSVFLCLYHVFSMNLSLSSPHKSSLSLCVIVSLCDPLFSVFFFLNKGREAP